MPHTIKILPVIGWKEWVALPALGVRVIKAKIDTGARTSSLHAFEIEDFERDGQRWARFFIHPYQKAARGSVAAEARIVDERWVRSSNGGTELRRVVETKIELMGERFTIELTLTRRDEMGYRMLLGRTALHGRFLVNSGRAYLGGRPKKKTKKKSPLTPSGRLKPAKPLRLPRKPRNRFE